MSAEEEVELRDLVTDVLELNGCLPKIKAQLRASVFLALDDDSKVSKQEPLLNKKVKTYLQSQEGQLMFCLVREFLEYFDLDFTASVYEPESYLDQFYKYEGREKIIEELGLNAVENNFTGPVLLHVVKVAQTKSKTLKIDLTNLNGDAPKEWLQNRNNEHNCSGKNNCHTKQDDSMKSNGNKLESTFVKKDLENDDTFNGTSSIEEESISVANTEETHKEDEASMSSEQDSPKSKSEERTKLSPKGEKLKSKLDLPPLQLNKSRDLLPSLYSKEFKEKSNKDFDFEIKDDYEEDFMSGSELDLSQKIASPKPVLEQLQNKTFVKNNNLLNKENSHSSSINSTENVETNLSVDEEISTNSSIKTRNS